MTATPPVDQDALDVLKQTFGYSAFRRGQAEVISRLLAGNNVLAVMPTGAGKSLCFQVPALVKGGLTVVVSPLVALMENQVAALRLSGVRAASINSAVSRDVNVSVWRQVTAGEIDLLYLSPERLMTDRMLAAVAKLNPSFFAIDEAHCISQWGPSFRPEYEDLSQLRTYFPNTPIIALTATADAVTRTHIQDKLFGGDADVFVTGFDRPNLHLAVEEKQNWKQQLRDFLEPRAGESGIVYCLSRKKTEEVAHFLCEAGHNALPYHAGMSQEDRSVHQDRFMTESGVVMVATIAFGMGIDKPDIRFVFHTDLPGGPEAYYQEIGRAGRDGNEASVHMLYGMDDIRLRRTFIENEAADDDRKRREHQRLDALLAYCEAPECRRRALLAYFNEAIDPCGKCDVCLNPGITQDGTHLAEAALTAIQETGQSFGAGHIVDVVTGKDTDKITRFRHDQLPSFGSGKSQNAKQWKSILRQLVATGFLDIDISGYGALQVAAKGKALLGGRESFRYRPTLAASKSSKSSGAMSFGSNKPSSIDLSEADHALLQELKKLRLELAKERNVPAYVVFGDRSLIDMALKRPTNEMEFAEVYGVGRSKLEKFGQPFIDLIRSQ